MTTSTTDTQSALQELDGWLTKLLTDKGTWDQPKIANQLKWYVLAHQHILDAIVEQHLYGICYRMVTQRTAAVRRDAWCVAQQKVADERVGPPPPDPPDWDKHLRGEARQQAIEMRKQRADWDARYQEEIDKAVINGEMTAYPLSPLVFNNPTGDVGLTEGQADLLERYAEAESEAHKSEARSLAIERQSWREQQKAWKLGQWQESNSEWAEYRETVAPHESKLLWMLDGDDRRAAIRTHKARFMFEQKTLQLLTTLDAGLAYDELVYEGFSPEDIERIAGQAEVNAAVTITAAQYGRMNPDGTWTVQDWQ